MPSYKIQPTMTLYLYLDIIYAMSRARMVSPMFYCELDKERVKLHDQILQENNTTRDDKDFYLELSKVIEEYLKKRED